MAFWSRRSRQRDALVADARVLQGPTPDGQSPTDNYAGDPRQRLYRNHEEWQREVWDFYDSLGEFSQGITWKANMLSRIRLRAAKIVPGQDEPQLIDSGSANDYVRELAGGIGGQSALMRSFAVFLNVPGECYLIGETLPNGVDKWYTRSLDEVKPSVTSDTGFSIAEGYGRWRDLPTNAIVVRVWRKHDRWHNVANAPARAARPLMRELELLNRHIQSQYLSRLASAGIVVFPDEITFPVRAEFKDAPDPFVAEWIEIAAEAVKTPGTASAIVPIPIKVPGEYVDKVRHLDFTLKLDDTLIQKRDSALTRLAIALDMPPEALLGTREVNHWCEPNTTMILTRTRGWVHQDQLDVDDVVLTFNTITRQSEWQPVLDVARFEVRDLAMRRLTGRFGVGASTLQHRWPVERDGRIMWRTTETLEPDDRILLAAPHAQLPTEPKYTDAFVELVAWFTTDGNFRRWQPKYRGTHQAVVAQSHVKHPAQTADIRRALTELMGESSTGRDKRNDIPRWREHIYDNSGMTIFVLNRAAADELTRVVSVPDKIVSRDFIYDLTRTQLEIFITTFVRGDGTLRDGQLARYTRASSQRVVERLDALELAGILLGYTVGRSTQMSDGFKAGVMTRQALVHPDNPVVPNGRVRVADRVEDITYTGTIWCPVTANGTWYAREEDGRVFITGNSAWLIDEQGVKIHVAPDAEIICNALTDGYLRPRLMLEDPASADEFVVWYDASELILRPDRSEAARELYDRFAINGESLRRENGFDETNAPSDDEQREMILLQASRQPVNTFAALAELGHNVADELLPQAPPPEQSPKPVAAPDKQGPQNQPDGPPPPGPNQPGPSETPTDGGIYRDLDGNIIALQGSDEPQLTFAELHRDRLVNQSKLEHAIKIDFDGEWHLFHPVECREHLFSCPVTHATWNTPLRALPGASGAYTCWLNASGQPLIGAMMPSGKLLDMHESPKPHTGNGHKTLVTDGTR